MIDVQKSELFHQLEKILGNGLTDTGDEAAFYCPFCKHHKQKLQINLLSGKCHCWVCDISSYNIPQLLRKLNISSIIVKQIADLTGTYVGKKNEKSKFVVLPKEFKLLYEKDGSIIYKHTINYLKKRQITSKQILRYNIGYCDSGIYTNRVIIPSYNKKMQLNYFVARDIFPDSTMKYKNPPAERNIIPFESLINFKHRIILTEGVFDAITVDDNAIPLLGKVPSRELVRTIVKEKPPKIYIALDNDARKDAIKLVELMMSFNIETYLIKLDEKDPSDLGYEHFWNLVDKEQSMTFGRLMREKLNG